MKYAAPLDEHLLKQSINKFIQILIFNSELQKIFR